ncbi:MAG: HmuY family protein [Bacteroidota bacterium]
MKKYLYFISGIFLLLTSCFKEDQMVSRHAPGNVKTDTVAMGQYYKSQVYFDLGKGQSVSTNLKSDFDLGFECGAAGWRVILNTSTFMKAADAGIRPFGQAIDTNGMNFKFDKSDGNLDSLAIGKWFTVQGNDTISNLHVYVINRGLDESGFELGMRQMIFDSLKNSTYYFRIANLNGSSQKSYSIAKEADYNFIYFTPKFGGISKVIEPVKGAYDLIFTQYTTLLYTDLGAPYPYIVTGVLLNRNNVEAVVDSIDSFESVTLSDVKGLPFKNTMDYIGYNWKKYDFAVASYTVNTKLVYIIKDTEGAYYKMRFVGFYNSQGVKGYPVIEFQLL